MRDYDIVIVIQIDLDEVATTGLIDKVSGWITDSGGSVEKIERWGKRHLAYQIRKQRDGYYVLFNARIQPSFVRDLERNLEITEPVLRYLITSQND